MQKMVWDQTTHKTMASDAVGDISSSRSEVSSDGKREWRESFSASTSGNEAIENAENDLAQGRALASEATTKNDLTREWERVRVIF